MAPLSLRLGLVAALASALAFTPRHSFDLRALSPTAPLALILIHVASLRTTHKCVSFAFHFDLDSWQRFTMPRRSDFPLSRKFRLDNTYEYFLLF